MLDKEDTAFSYERELIVRSILQGKMKKGKDKKGKGKWSSLKLICIAHTTFLLCGAEV